MRDSALKDKILKSLIEDKKRDTTQSLADKLNIPPATVYTLCLDMAKQHHIEALESASINFVYGHVVRLLPQGEHFYYKSSYQKEAFKQWFTDLPKKYWLFIAIISYLIGLATPILQDKLKSGILPQTKPAPIKQSLVNRDSTAKHK